MQGWGEAAGRVCPLPAFLLFLALVFLAYCHQHYSRTRFASWRSSSAQEGSDLAVHRSQALAGTAPDWGMHMDSEEEEGLDIGRSHRDIATWQGRARREGRLWCVASRLEAGIDYGLDLSLPSSLAEI